ncbi:unnamed protein product (macronuclear) [Paramecium tetraurelia]|uniref:Uncharacterized protein n=1 Tax=Paramecium tetraurelia TaxID=5888 RepID=A0D8T6_PARTE|nr:uncharacterized protein GSPATT00014399001 [Paramecium tetraurelia]CAK79453.1 unnamed protein product [Paramecium tetraurelia]|eukprot:XP_001446850.1 hypothetical protein (macronuclear) [Paramecium tetraurelia strain d4-2]
MKTHLLFALILGSIFHFVVDLDFVKGVTKIENYSGCEYLNLDIPGAEDILQYGNHLIFASGNLAEIFAKGTPELKQASFYIVQNAHQQSTPIQMHIEGFPSNVAFYPHGLHLWKNNQIYYIFAVNHAYIYGGERVEVFRIIDDLHLEYQHSFIMGQQYTGTLKDLIVVSPDRFLITKLMPYTDPIEGRNQWGFGMKIKNLGVITLKFQYTNILDCTFDLKHIQVIPNCHVISSQQFSWAGGITWDQDKTVWVGDNLRKTIYQFKLEEEGLKKEHTIKLPHQIDNINYDEINNKLIFAMNPKGYQTILLNLHLKGNDLSRQSTYSTWSSVGEYSLQTNQTTIIYQSNQYIRGISNALIMQNKLYLSSWADIAPMVCYK